MNDVAQRLANLTPAQRALLQKRLQQKPDVAQPIAVVGMSCRFSGAKNLDEFWDRIRRGETAIAEVPESRWDADEFYDPNPDAPGKMATRWGAFIDDVDAFDPLFFGIAPREASRMDPQQRLLLEVSWEALEHAGIAPESLAGSATGVFVGIGGTDYSKIPTQFSNYYEFMDPHVGTGNALSISANRVSYIMDLRGPSIAVDTACSSGLVALHMAIQSLRSGEASLALAGGVNLVLCPDVSIAFSKARMLSPTGQCRPFDEAANGYVRGEGCGMVILKRLVDATRDGDDIVAVIRGSAVNQDGRTSGITAPNALSQQACILAAQAAAGVTAGEITYVEAHGTGTPLGDPIEFQSLGKVFPRKSPQDPKCHVTSAKALIGHTETVSGIAGLIKVVLMLKNQWIPAQPLLDNMNPNIDVTGTRLEIPTEGVAWETSGPRIAGVSSFGFGGTNSHVILEGVPASVTESEAPAGDRPKHVLAISARTKKALPRVAARLRDRLTEVDDDQLANFCYSANVGRSHFNNRIGAVAASRSQLIEQLDAVANEKRAKGAKKGEVRIAIKPKVGFLFTGQGSQYAGMGKQLYDEHPAFRSAMDVCDAAFVASRGESLLSIIYPDEGGDADRIHQTEFTQPCLFALEYSVAKLWQSWGIQPSVMLGHSVGEYVAACIAGVFSVEDGVRLIAKRAELMQSLPAGGKMAVIFAKRERVAEVIAPYGEQIAIATANGPENNAISGEAAIVDEVVEQFEKEGTGTVALAVSHAFHSPLMDPILDEFEQFASSIDFQRPLIPIVANRSGKLVDTAEFTAAYWRDHIRNAVEFEEGVNCLADQDLSVLLEVGPTTALLGMGRRCRGDMDVAWVPSLRKGKDNWDTLLTAVTELYVAGCRVDWEAFDASWPRRRLSLPTYPFERMRLWYEVSEKGVGAVRGKSVHPLLGARLPMALDATMLETRLSADAPGYLKDHVVQGSTVVPGAAYIEQGLALAEQLFGKGDHALENVTIQQAMFLPAEGHRIVQVIAGSEMGGRASFDVYSMDPTASDEQSGWALHATGRLVHADALVGGDPPKFDLEELRDGNVRERTRAEFYEILDERNLQYGPIFQVLGLCECQIDGMLSELQIPEAVSAEAGKYLLHPALGDACMQGTAGTVPMEVNGDFSPYTYMPMSAKRVRFWGCLDNATHVYARRTSEINSPSPANVTADVFMLDASGKALFEIGGVKLIRVGAGIAGSSENVDDWLYQVAWEAQAGASQTNMELTGNYVVLADGDEKGQGGVAQGLAARLVAAGGQVTLAVPGEQFASPSSADEPFVIRPTSDEDMAALLSAASGDDSAAVSGIVHLWGLRTERPDSNAEALVVARDLSCASILRVFQQAARFPFATPPSVWLVTQDAIAIGGKKGAGVQQAPTWGMGRVAAMEHPELSCRVIDLDDSDGCVDQLFAELCSPSSENQIAFGDGKRFVARLAELGQNIAGPDGGLNFPTGSPFQLRIADTGSFDSLSYRAFAPAEPNEGQVEVEVAATGLNFSDVLKAMGLYPGVTDSIVPIGIECSGTVTRVGAGVDRFKPGDAVMGVAPYAFGSHTTTNDYALVHKPDVLDHEEASTVPITFMTAYYGLRRLADLQPGERVLIHAGAGGVGLAAIQICQQVGDVEIFATAGSDEKREFLRSLGVQHVMNSRTLDFADEILAVTNREGVDVVLNSLPGDAIAKSLGVLRAYGRFLEIGKTDIYQNSMIGLAPFQDNLSYFAIDLDRMLRQRPDYVLGLFAEVMTHFESGDYEALPLTRFSAGQTVEAFRYMAQRKNIGKVVVAMHDRPVESTSSHDRNLAAVGSEGTYLVTGGLGALGMQVAEWLLEKGAKYVALMSRRKPQGDVADRLTTWNEQGLRVVAVQGDVADRESLDQGLQQIPSDFPPLKGIVHAAGVLADGVMFDMGLDQLDKPLGPKVQGTWNLHAATQDQELDFMVLFSSVASVLGSPGQSNYAAANSFLDAVAVHRTQEGMPTLSINWGPWADSGMAAEAGRDDQLAARGMGLLRSDKAFQALEILMSGPSPNATVMAVNWADLMKASGNRALPPILTSVTEDIEVAGSADSAEDLAFRESIGKADVPERKKRLNAYFADQLAAIMGLDPEEIDVTQPLNTLGLDSLMAIELKNKIENRLKLTLPMALFMKEPSISTLATHVAETFGIESSKAPVDATGEAKLPAPETSAPAASA